MKLARYVAIAITLGATNVHAGAREENAAKQALTHAHAFHGNHQFARALAMLTQAEKACEPDRCSPSTLAALLRDVGTMQLATGDETSARSNFAAALAFDASIELDSAYVTAALTTVWNDVQSPGAKQTQPSGDFDHVPAREQTQSVPLPVYVEYPGSAHPASVVLRYQGPGMSSYARLVLQRIGAGWGNVIPCGAVKLGTMHYYVQGFDAEGLPILDGGNKRHPYSVPVRAHIDGSPPSLPGHRAPTTCGEGLDDITESETPSAETKSTKAVSSATHARFWFGLTGMIDITVLPTGKDVCAQDASGNAVDASWACTSDTPEGTDFPASKTEAATLVQGKSGEVTNGVQPGDVRVMLTFGYAVTSNLVVGGAFGYVAGAYGGGLPKFPPIHLEARATWIFGSEPLSRVGFAPYAMLAAGVAEFDANLGITVAQNGIAGSRPVQAWHVGGPGFVALEGGARFAFSPRVGLLLGARGTLAFGASTFPAFGPTMSLELGL